MQNYGQQQPGFQRPGSVASFGAAPGTAPPPPYGGQPGYQSAAPQAQSQWAPPAQNLQPNQQWSQPQQGAGGYNPGVYGAMPGAYTQGQQAPNQVPAAYATQQQDNPPPPPPKPAGFVAPTQQQPQTQQPLQQNTQSWGQQQGYGVQQTPQGYQAPQQAQQGQQGGYAQQNGYPNQGVQQPAYNNAAPPPPSQTPGGSYFPPAQATQQGRPGSIYGADQAGAFSSPASATGQPPSNSVLSPNEQQPAYIPPSLTGQGVQSYMPANTNPMPGVYIPPPPDIPAWQQAQHAPLQGGKKFRYTKPSVDPSFYAQGYQGVQPMQPQQQQQQQGQFGQQPAQIPQTQQQFAQPVQNQFQPQAQPQVQPQVQPQIQPQVQPQFQQQQQAQFGQPQNQYPQVQAQPQGQFGQPAQQQAQVSQQGPVQYQTSGDQTNQTFQQPQQIQQQQQNQWQSTPGDQGFNQQQQQNAQGTYPAQQPIQQQAWQAGQPTQGQMGQQYTAGQEQTIQAPKPIGHTGATPPGFVNQPSPQSTPVSPVQHRQSVNYGSSSNHIGLGRTSSVSSIALGAIHAQRAGNRTESPKPLPAKVPTPPPPRDDKSRFSVLDMGGPSDWEHFGGGVEEIDDEEFFTKKGDKKTEPVQLDSVELPARVPSPPSAQGDWPSPASQAAHPGLRRQDTFQPTPPTSLTPVPEPSAQTQQQSFVMGDAPPPAQPRQSFVMGDAPPQQASQSFVMGDAPPQQVSQSFVMGDAPPQHAPQSFVMGDAPAQTPSPQPPASSQQGFVMGDSWVQPTNQETHVRQPSPNQPATGHQGFIVGDSGASQVPPAQASQGRGASPQPLQTTNTSFVMGDGNWGATEQTPTQKSGGWASQPNTEHLAELKAKDEAYERLRCDSEKEKADVRSELSKLNVVVETLKAQAESERKLMQDKIEQLKQAAVREKGSTDALNKEKTIEIERLKEDAEGKDDTIKERDATIAEVRRQLQESKESVAKLRADVEEKTNALSDLQRQLAEQQSKAASPPTAADLVPDVGPWYISSLERFIVMLKTEAFEPVVEEKVKTFTSFMESESGIRGIPYYKAPPAGASVQGPAQSHLEHPVGMPSDRSDGSVRNKGINIQVPSGIAPNSEDEFDYSPGGRPMLRRKTTIKSEEIVPAPHSFSMTSDPSGGQNTVYTPTSSQDEDMSKTPTPIQSPPEEQPKPQYKPYVPPSMAQGEPASSVRQQSVSFAPTAPAAPPQAATSGKHIDDIFFEPKPANQPTPSARSSSVTSLPPPLFSQSATPAPVQKKDPLDILKDLVPAQVVMPSSSELDEIRKKLSGFTSDFSFIQETTGTWEREAALTRKKNDDARRKRQEESEARTDELYNDNQIAYVDIGPIEDEFKEKERVLKAQEDRDEYKSYVESVFDKIYDDLQSQIKDLMDFYIEVETLVQTSVSGVKSMEQEDVVSTAESLKLLKELHDMIEARHEKVVLAVAERDKRYKKTEIQPLYAAGNITKMKSVEKHFDNAEKQAILRAKSEKAERIDGLVRLTEDAVVGAVKTETDEIDAILAAIRELPDDSDEQLLTRARETLLALKSSSKALLELFNGYEIELNTAVIEGEIAQARAENAGPERITELEQEQTLGEKKIRDEFVRRVQVIDQDKDEIDALIEQKGGKATLSEEEEKKLRLQRALEAAKKRNGDL